MELNELRQLWNQQPTQEPAPLSEQGVARMVARKSDGVVTRLRRNAWWEVACIVYIIIVLPFGINYFQAPFIKNYLLVSELLSVGFLYYYYCKFKLLRRMDQVDENVRGYLQTLILGLRDLLAIYLRLTIWVAVAAFVAVTSYQVYRFTLEYEGMKLVWGVGLLLTVMLVANSILYWLIIRFTKWYLQKLYGQHLDRLEGYLEELKAE